VAEKDHSEVECRGGLLNFRWIRRRFSIISIVIRRETGIGAARMPSPALRTRRARVMLFIAASVTATGSDNPFDGASVMTGFTFDDIAVILAALKFSAQRHRDQRRKDAVQTPYINHPIEVADLLWRVGNVHDLRALVAALLHDIIEDTETSPGEIERSFGGEVLSLVLEVSDDKRLPKAIRKSLQIRHAPNLSLHAKAIKLADKICNTLDITHSPPHDWPVERRLEYLDWTEKVVAGLRGSNAALESLYDRVLAEGRAIVERAGGSGE